MDPIFMILSPSLLRLPGQHIHGGLDGLSHSSALPGRSGSVQSPVVSHPRMSHGGVECRRDSARKLRAGGCHQKDHSLDLIDWNMEMLECMCCVGQPCISGSWRPAQPRARPTGICELSLPMMSPGGFQGEFQPHIWLPMSVISFRFRESADSIPLAT